MSMPGYCEKCGKLKAWWNWSCEHCEREKINGKQEQDKALRSLLAGQKDGQEKTENV